MDCLTPRRWSDFSKSGATELEPAVVRQNAIDLGFKDYMYHQLCWAVVYSTPAGKDQHDYISNSISFLISTEWISRALRLIHKQTLTTRCCPEPWQAAGRHPSLQTPRKLVATPRAIPFDLSACAVRVRGNGGSNQGAVPTAWGVFASSSGTTGGQGFNNGKNQQHRGGGGQKDAPGGGGQRENGLGPGPADAGDADRRKFACPFYKLDPVNHAHCLQYNSFDSPRRVKEHLTTRGPHHPPHCPKCWEIFENSLEKDEHIRQSECEAVPETEDFAATAVSTNKRKLLGAVRGGDEKAWYKMWDVIAGGHSFTRPESPYLDDLEQKGISLRASWMVVFRQVNSVLERPHSLNQQMADLRELFMSPRHSQAAPNRANSIQEAIPPASRQSVERTNVNPQPRPSPASHPIVNSPPQSPQRGFSHFRQPSPELTQSQYHGLPTAGSPGYVNQLYNPMFPTHPFPGAPMFPPNMPQIFGQLPQDGRPGHAYVNIQSPVPYYGHNGNFGQFVNQPFVNQPPTMIGRTHQFSNAQIPDGTASRVLASGVPYANEDDEGEVFCLGPGTSSMPPGNNFGGAGNNQ